MAFTTRTTGRTSCGVGSSRQQPSYTGRAIRPVALWQRRVTMRAAMDESEWTDQESGLDGGPSQQRWDSDDLPMPAYLRQAEHATAVEGLDSFTCDLLRLQAFEAYQRELQKRPAEVDLLACAVLIAKATKYPQVSIDAIRAEIDRLAEEVERHLARSPIASGRYPMLLLRSIITVLYHQQGFHGNHVDFFADDNSMMNKVLEDKTGIPITLSLLFQEVAQRVGMPMKGVNLPAHFMLQPDLPTMQVLVDAFAGEVVFLEEAEEKLSQLMGHPFSLDQEEVKARKGVPPRTFLTRMLFNLKQIYIRSSDPDMALRVIRLMRVTQPESASEVRDEGLCLYSMARYGEAAQSLESYLQMSPQAEDVLMVSTVLEGCRVLIKEQRGR